MLGRVVDGALLRVPGRERVGWGHGAVHAGCGWGVGAWVRDFVCPLWVRCKLKKAEAPLSVLKGLFRCRVRTGMQACVSESSNYFADQCTPSSHRIGCWRAAVTTGPHMCPTTHNEMQMQVAPLMNCNVPCAAMSWPAQLHGVRASPCRYLSTRHSSAVTSSSNVVNSNQCTMVPLFRMEETCSSSLPTTRSPRGPHCSSSICSAHQGHAMGVGCSSAGAWAGCMRARHHCMQALAALAAVHAKLAARREPTHPQHVCLWPNNTHPHVLQELGCNGVPRHIRLHLQPNGNANSC